MAITLETGRRFFVTYNAGTSRYDSAGLFPAGSAPGIPTSTPLTDEQWQTLLTRTGGTEDTVFDVDADITYVGAFRVPYFQGGLNTRVGTAGTSAIAYRPPDGSNGPNGSIYLGNGDTPDGSTPRGFVCELQIPTLSDPSETDYTNLNAATIIQDWTDVFSLAPTGNTQNENNKVGWLHFVGGKLFVSGYNYYDTSENNHHVLVCEDPTDLANSSYIGFLDSWPGDRGSRYVADVPTSLQASFGGEQVSGVCAELAIVSRASYGPSLYSWTGANVQTGDTAMPSTEIMHYPNGNEVAGFSGTNSDITDYYGNLLFPDASTYDLTIWYDPQGEDITNWGLYGMAAFNGVPIGDPQGRTRTNFDGLPLPDESVRKHVFQYATRVGCAFFAPGTDTFVLIGSNDGARFGYAYKNYTIEDGPSGSKHGGFGLVSKNDRDTYVWLYNINDILNVTNTYDPVPYLSRPKNDLGPFCGGEHNVMTGYFDKDNSRLYLLGDGFYQSAYNSQHVVSVFDVTGVR